MTDCLCHLGRSCVYQLTQAKDQEKNISSLFPFNEETKRRLVLCSLKFYILISDTHVYGIDRQHS